MGMNKHEADIGMKEAKADTGMKMHESDIGTNRHKPDTGVKRGGGGQTGHFRIGDPLPQTVFLPDENLRLAENRAGNRSYAR
jgi:hypothetical protein